MTPGKAHSNLAPAWHGEPALDRVRPTAWAALAAICLVWIVLGQTAFSVGPSEWDDNLYCDLAALPRPLFETANRYVHVWTLRVFNAVIDSRRDAAAWYANLVVVGLCGVGFLLGRRAGGVGCGLLAAALMPLYPALLRYVTVPYPDPPMTLWGGLALACALAAGDDRTRRRRMLALAASGFFGLLSIKCKETGLAVLPALAVVLWQGRGSLGAAGLWALGALAGWLLLSVADALFLGDFWWSWKLSSYVPKPGEPPIKGTIRQDMDYLHLLLATEFLPFTLLGVAGAVIGLRENAAVRGLAVWSFGALAFSTLISCRYMGLHALDRYCVAIGVPLVVLSAYWVHRLWTRCPNTNAGHPLGWLTCTLLTSGLALYGLLAEVFGEAGPYVSRFAFFAMPVAFLVLFLAPWVAGGRAWVRISILAILFTAATVAMHDARDYVLMKREVIRPWATLAVAMDDAGVQLARWNMPAKPYAGFRIGRRCRVLSRRAPGDIEVREVKSLAEVKENEWLISTPDVAAEVRREGWRPVVNGGEQGGAFAVYRRESQVKP